MIAKINQNAFGVVEYAVSKEEEVAQVPHLVGQGSTCIVIATANVYMFDEEDSSWHSLVDGTIIVPNALKPKTREIELAQIQLPEIKEVKKVKSDSDKPVKQETKNKSKAKKTNNGGR